MPTCSPFLISHCRRRYPTPTAPRALGAPALAHRRRFFEDRLARGDVPAAAHHAGPDRWLLCRQTQTLIDGEPELDDYCVCPPVTMAFPCGPVALRELVTESSVSFHPLFQRHHGLEPHCPPPFAAATAAAGLSSTPVTAYHFDVGPPRIHQARSTSRLQHDPPIVACAGEKGGAGRIAMQVARSAFGRSQGRWRARGTYVHVHGFKVDLEMQGGGSWRV
ncbi:hypothetical protein C8J57DRAFT_1506062 [Mycena rebaudengoi]|nr:hypothetical protein C8J57DRAFT_1506062 [Mycena rebaudengoi]